MACIDLVLCQLALALVPFALGYVSFAVDNPDLETGFDFVFRQFADACVDLEIGANQDKVLGGLPDQSFQEEIE